MAVQTAIARPIGTLHVGLLGMVLIAAAAFGAGIGLGASDWLAPASRTQALAQPASAFNAPGFRLGEKLPLAQPAPAFNAPAFRLGEKVIVAQPARAFNAPAFRPAFDVPGFQLGEELP